MCPCSEQKIKEMKYLILMFLISSILSCQETDEIINTNDLNGTWQLVEVLADPGDGSGTYQPIDSDWIISFNSDGSFYSTNKLCNQNVDDPEDESGTYDKADQQISIGSCSFRVGYEIVNSKLILQYPCIEACGQKFAKLSSEN